MKKIIFIFCCTISNIAYSQNVKSNIDQLSLSSCYTIATNGTKELWNASGFFIIVKDKVYFITNNHVVGDDFAKTEYIRDHHHSLPVDSIPDKLKIRVYSGKINSTFNVELPLINRNKVLYIKFWEDSPNNLKPMDVVAIPVDDVTKIQLNNTIEFQSKDINEDLKLAPSGELFIIGFPFNYGQYNAYPIFKRGTIATEPNLEIINNYSFNIDATTRSGMSGSPVVFEGNLYNTKSGTALSAGSGAIFLVGIYSAQNYYMEIGTVWKMDIIFKKLEEIN
ncbi:trypsin-like peptidase domain-containing protein [Mucilaginibacter sp.]